MQSQGYPKIQQRNNLRNVATTTLATEIEIESGRKWKKGAVATYALLAVRMQLAWIRIS